MTLRQLEAGTREVENQYPRVVKREGNRVAQRSGRQGLRGVRPQMARRRLDSAKRLPAARGVSRPRRRALFEVEGIDTQESADLHQRPGPARREKAARLPGLRQATARRSIRSARRWFPPRAPAPPTTPMAGICTREQARTCDAAYDARTPGRRPRPSGGDVACGVA